MFEPNRGQVDAQVQFMARGRDYTLYLTRDQAVVALHGAAPVTVRAAGAARPTKIEGLEPTGGLSNYLRGNDPSRWQIGIPHYRKVQYSSIYPGIDLTYYGNPQKLEYDFVVAAWANPNQIQVEYDGAESLAVDAHGDLIVKTAAGELIQLKPRAYQENSGQRVEVEARYRLVDRNRVMFALSTYEKGRPLVIDPVLIYSTHFGGALFDYATGIAVDTAGNAYVTGTTDSSDFPVVSSLQSKYRGGSADAFVAKISADGGRLLYATYLGGSGHDQATGIGLGGDGSAYITGLTSSTDFPTIHAPREQYAGGPSDAFVTRLSPDGSGLVYSTYFGGTGEDRATGIAVDSNDNAYITGTTSSTDFMTANPMQAAHGGGSTDGFVTKIAPDGDLIYSTYLGGNDLDEAFGIAVDPAGSAYVTGRTKSRNFPTANPLQAVNGGVNAFVTKLAADGNSLLYSTYLGGSKNGSRDNGGDDAGRGVAVDGSGNAYVAGSTRSLDFPTANALQTEMKGPSQNAFAAKIAADGGTLLYSTYLGGTGSRNAGDYAVAIGLDAGGNAYISGFTHSSDFPLRHAIQPDHPEGSQSAFVTSISADGSSLLYSTYLGASRAGVGTGAMLGIAVDRDGNAYVTGYPGADSAAVSNSKPNLRGGSTTFVAKISAASANSSVPGNVSAHGARFIQPQARDGSIRSAIATVNLNATPNPAAFGSPVTLLASLNPPTATGTVTFYDRTTVLGTRTIAGGSASLITRLLPAGSRALRAIYSGDSNFSLATSAIFTETVNVRIPSDRFLNTGTLALVNQPYSVAVGDFNGDGKADIAVAAGGATVFLGNGDGTFGTGVNYTAGTQPQAITTGDFNGDGITDLAVANYQSHNVSILLGNGNGTFQAPLNNPVGLLPVSLAVADFNGDGKADVVASNSGSNNVSVLLGNGNGTFALAAHYMVGNNPNGVAVGDFNGDGIADVAVADFGGVNTVSVLLGTGSGTLGAASSYAAGSDPFAIIVADFNGDGRADIAVSNSAGSNSGSVLVGNGNGTFQPPATLATGPIPNQMALGDFNGDGRVDIAVGNNSGGISIMLGNGNATFLTPVSYPAGTNPFGLAVADFNGDGRPDLAVANLGSSNVSILLGVPVTKVGVFRTGNWFLDANNTTTFDTGDRAFGWGSANSIPVIGDWNGDGHTKVAVFDNGVWSIDYNGSGFLDAGDITVTWGQAGDVPVVGDWNGNGKTKIGIYRAGLWLLDFNGTFNFSARQTVVWGDGASQPVVGDWNGDGRTKVGIFKQGTWAIDVNGNGVLDGGIDKIFAWGSSTAVPVVGDWNGNGRTKIGTYDKSVWSLDYNGSWVFDTGDLIFQWGFNGAVPIVGDWNGDGRAKIGVFANGIWYLDVDGSTLLNTGDRIFAWGATGDQLLTGRW